MSTPRGPKPTYNHAEVARLYMEGGRQPTSHVAQAMGVTRNVAAKRVKRVRELGLLPPAEKGHATWVEHHSVLAVAARGTVRQRQWTVCVECLTPWPCAAATPSPTASG